MKLTTIKSPTRINLNVKCIYDILCIKKKKKKNFRIINTFYNRLFKMTLLEAN